MSNNLKEPRDVVDATKLNFFKKFDIYRRLRQLKRFGNQLLFTFLQYLKNFDFHKKNRNEEGLHIFPFSIIY